MMQIDVNIIVILLSCPKVNLLLFTSPLPLSNLGIFVTKSSCCYVCYIYLVYSLSDYNLYKSHYIILPDLHLELV